MDTIKTDIKRAVCSLPFLVSMQELYAIGTNLNQIAARANVTGHIDSMTFQCEANPLRKALLDIQAAVTLPEKMEFREDKSNIRR